ncbi:hypothetical protein Q8F55_005028 [Vanrija albida]|uniref:Uncharacterized protein n=1 Tax=Vanrija albida TaxID=181172 RepID=A0ABR3Q0T7_9TREE
MSTIGFIINGVRKGSFIAPEWWPDAGMTVWIFATGLNQADMRQMAWRLRQVEWLPDQGSVFLRRPLDTLRQVMDGTCTVLPEHAWRAWAGEPRWAYFDFDTGEYEIWRHGSTDLCSGRASFEDLTWDAWCAMRQRLLDQENKELDDVELSLTASLSRIQI